MQVLHFKSQSEVDVDVDGLEVERRSVSCLEKGAAATRVSGGSLSARYIVFPGSASA